MGLRCILFGHKDRILHTTIDNEPQSETKNVLRVCERCTLILEHIWGSGERGGDVLYDHNNQRQGIVGPTITKWRLYRGWFWRIFEGAGKNGFYGQDHKQYWRADSASFWVEAY